MDWSVLSSWNANWFVNMAAQLERMISPEATYPVVGRSIVYRFGAFHALSQIALLDKIPQPLSKGQIRSALTAVMQRQISMPGTFDENGWLKIGFSGSQINMSEPYINTGSLYMCTAVFCHWDFRQIILSGLSLIVNGLT